MTREKTLGIKLPPGVDTNGLPHAVRVTAADVTDRDVAVETLRRCAPNLPKVAKVLCDGGYGGENFANAARMLPGAEAEAVKRNGPHTFAAPPKRGGWLSAVLRGWKNTAVFGKTANVIFILRCK
jgi:transposase